ncbi:hypothetical protein C1645_566668 [Glomus cerebriforme]|uniref:Uncharacterized protein n=1 Tax=Glomus cerebriforme TaxID=658196 RepID=A0A397T902_9GLOM|nr:hypothetical protein C1645_566668 [Glomus cerebriforme]
MPETKHRRSDDPSCHHMGCSCLLLYDQHWQTSGVFDFARSADEMGDPTLKPVGEMGFNFRANTRECRDNQEQINQGPNPTDNNSCGVEIRRTDDENLVRGVANRKQEYQKAISKVTTGIRFTDPSSLSSGREWEFEKESRVLAIRELCGDDHIVPSSIMETGTTNRNLCDKHIKSRNDATLLELPPNHESQHTQDVASLLELLKNKYSYREATNNVILPDYEIQLLDGIYRITDYRIVLACRNYCYWFEVPDGVIYLWSRLDYTLVRGGDNIKEALKNFLFHRENLRYVDENSLELIPLDEYDEEAEEWAKSPEAYINIDVTKLSLKHESKMGGKKKQQKKKKNKKNKNKH